MASQELAVTQPTRRRKPKREPTWQESFLRVLGETRSVREACKEAGVGRTNTYAERDRDPGFRQAWDDIIAAKVDRLQLRVEDIAFDEADKKSLEAATFLLRFYRPEVFSDNAKLRELEDENRRLRLQVAVVMEAFEGLDPEARAAIIATAHEKLLGLEE